MDMDLRLKFPISKYHEKQNACDSYQVILDSNHYLKSSEPNWPNSYIMAQCKRTCTSILPLTDSYYLNACCVKSDTYTCTQTLHTLSEKHTPTHRHTQTHMHTDACTDTHKQSAPKPYFKQKSKSLISKPRWRGAPSLLLSNGGLLTETAGVTKQLNRGRVKAQYWLVVTKHNFSPILFKLSWSTEIEKDKRKSI